MIVFVNAWIKSLFFFFPPTLWAYLKRTIITTGRAFFLLLRYLPWLILTDVFFFWIAGNNLFTPSQLPNATTMLFSIIATIFGFIVSCALFLLICKDPHDLQHPLSYFKTAFFHYILLMFFFSFTLILILAFFALFGISQLPPLHWIIPLLFKTFELFTIFYWLSMPPSLTNIFAALERASNLFLYNLPIMLFFIGILWAADYSIKHFFLDLTQHSHLLLTEKLELAAKTIPHLSRYKLLLFKYLKLILEGIWMSMLFVFYQQKKNIRYTNSYFK